MTIPLVNASTWGSNAELTSLQANELDLHITWALDKRAGQTDTLASDVTVTGGLTVQDTGVLTVFSTLDTGIESLSTFAGPVVITGGVDAFLVESGATVTFASGAVLTTNTNAQVTIGHLTATVKSTDTITVKSSGHLTGEAGSILGWSGSAAFVGINLSGTLALGASASISGTSGAEFTMGPGTVNTIDGDLALAAETFRTGSETRSGTGAWTAHRRYDAPNADTTIVGTQFDSVKIPNTVGSGRKYTLTTSPTPPNGCRIRFFRQTGTSQIALVVDDLGNSLAYGGVFPVVATMCWTDFQYSSAVGGWEACANSGTT